MIIDSVAFLLQVKRMSETPFHHFVLIVPVLIFVFDKFNEKNKVLKLFLHILLLISLVYAFRYYRSFLVKELYGTFIIITLIMFIDTLRDIFNIKNTFISWFYKILVKLSSILLLPLTIKNALLYKLYNIDINREELPYVNIYLIQVFALQWLITSIFIFSDMEKFLTNISLGLQ